MEPDPNRGSFDASAYPSLAELVVRYSTHETRLALRHLSMSWHKEVTRYFCRALDLKADRIGWRGLSLVSPDFKGNGEFAHIWRNDGYGEINDSFDLVSVISASGEDGDGRDGSDMAPIPPSGDQLGAQHVSEEEHDRELFARVTPHTAAFLKCIEDGLYASKTITIHGRLLPRGYRFLNRYTFDTVRILGTARHPVDKILLTARNLIVVSSVRFHTSWKPSTTLVIPDGTVSFTYVVDVEEYSPHLMFSVPNFPQLQVPASVRDICIYVRLQKKPRSFWSSTLLKLLQLLVQSVIDALPRIKCTFVNLECLYPSTPHEDIFGDGVLQDTLDSLKAGRATVIAQWINKTAYSDMLTRIETLYGHLPFNLQIAHLQAGHDDFPFHDTATLSQALANIQCMEVEEYRQTVKPEQFDLLHHSPISHHQ